MKTSTGRPMLRSLAILSAFVCLLLSLPTPAAARPYPVRGGAVFRRVPRTAPFVVPPGAILPVRRYYVAHPPPVVVAQPPMVVAPPPVVFFRPPVTVYIEAAPLPAPPPRPGVYRWVPHAGPESELSAEDEGIELEPEGEDGPTAPPAPPAVAVPEGAAPEQPENDPADEPAEDPAPALDDQGLLTREAAAHVEAQILELVNRERLAAGLDPLVPNPPLVVAARGHSRDMFARNFFAHENPDPARRTFSLRLQAAGLRNHGMAGENIALASDTHELAARFVQMWLDSPAHRENLLRPGFRYTGIGVWGGNGRIYATQDFAADASPAAAPIPSPR